MAPKPIPDPKRVIPVRKAARDTVTKIFDKVKAIITNDDYSTEQKVHLLERKLQDLDDNLQSISDMDEQIASTLDPNDLPNELTETTDVNFNNKDQKDEFDFELERLKKVLAAKQAPNPTDPPQNPNPNPNPVPDPDPPRRSAKRPDINLPVFDGDILNWPSFWQAFDNEINSDPRTPAITKYTYLLGQLAPKIAGNIRGLTPSAANYPKLVTYLTERYGRPNLIINKYMRTLYNLPKPETRAGLQSFHDTLEMCIGGLESLGKTADMYGDLLVVILLDKFPDSIYENLSRRHDSDEWTLDQLRTALTNELRLFEERPSLQLMQPVTSTTLFVDASSKPVKSKLCHFCAGSHASTNCTVHVSPEERSKIAIKKGLCLNCLASGHRKTECTSKFRCKVCKAAHHSSLHDNKRTKEATDTSAAKVTAAVLSVSTPETAVVAAAMLQQASSPFVFLKTAIARVRSECKSTLANIVFDDAAQRSFITSKLASMLGLKPVAVEYLILSGIKAKPFGPGLYNLTRVGIVDRLGNTVTILAVILEEIVAPLDEKPRKALTTLNYLKDLPLAHPVSNDERFAVDLLIGGNFYWHFMIDEIPIRGPGPVATNSRLGYLISGSLTEMSVEEYNHSTILTVITEEESDLQRLWSLEAFGIFGEGKFDHEARNYVQQSIEYKNDKYVAKFPWKADHPTLPSNYNIVRNMTRATIRKLAKKPELLSLFDRLIRHQLDQGFIEIVPDSDFNKRCHYIPYHYVTKDSSTTPIRIVYNCSQKGWNGVSFNDCVETGPALHNDQSSILIRFRTFAIGIVADVEKAFHHVGLHESDRDFLRWFWLKDPKDPDSELIIFRFKVVPFGAKSSPFMLNATIWRHLGTVASPVAADMLRSIYVDNIISGCDSRQEALNYYKSANEVMERANLPLQSWGFSDKMIEEQLLSDGRLDESPVSKTLGLLWDRRDDTLHVQNVNLSPLCQETATKRDVLKGVASFYDPLGMYSPLSIRGRVLLQDLHRNKIKLDDRLSQQHLELWREIAKDMETATKDRVFSIPRSYFGSVIAVRELHIFCDASKRAFGAVAYLLHNQKTAFVLAKSRVTPIGSSTQSDERDLTNPETELMAALMGSLLAESIAAALEVMGIRLRIFLWSDSQIVLYWIFKSDGYPRQFIANRVKKIQEISTRRLATWKFVRTTDNPADILSRGCTSTDLKTSVLWKSGPEWLPKKELWPDWSAAQFKQSVVLHVSQTNEEVPSIYNSIDPSRYRWTKLLRCTAVIQRFINNLKLRDTTRQSWKTEPISASELQSAELIWIQATQKKFCKQELGYLQEGKKGRRPPLVSHLDLHLENGILKCGGRLNNAELSQAAKHPIFIPKNSDIAALIIASMHERMFHANVDLTITAIRQRYWIPSLRQRVKSIVHRCVHCRKDSGAAYPTPDPGQLPSVRVREAYPFSTTGVDYTGAIPLKTPHPAYILLFTCGVTRAVHLEVVQDMTVKSFLDAFRRFTGHHPVPKFIYSDNATTFVGAQASLKKIVMDPQVSTYFADRQVEWRFIPKRAPWFGGFWERLIGLTKTCLRKMIGRNKLDFDDLRTAVTELEAGINDRPLTYVSSELESLEPLTPSHFLYGQRLTTLPYSELEEEEADDPSYGVKPPDLRKRFIRRLNVQKTFWKLWKTNYLLSLREHHQKTRGRFQEVIKVGDVVQIHDEGKRSGWKLAIVEGLVRGSDGVVRSADLKTARGKTDRPISKLYPIEVHIQKEAEPVAEAVPEPSRRPVRAAAEAARIRIIETAAEEED